MTDDMSAEAFVPRWRELVAASRAVRMHAYAPYSKFRVGAAVLCDDGRIFTGCNVENASYGLTVCAERTAVCQAVAAGDIRIVAVCISLAGEPSPCGACRQFLAEFNPEMDVLLDNTDIAHVCCPQRVPLSDLLPRAFRL